MPAGYSGTPLAKKLTLKDGMRVWFNGMPDSIRAEIDSFGLDLHEVCVPEGEGDLDAVHIFETHPVLLRAQLYALPDCIKPTGQVWVSWPKKAAKIPTEIDEHDVRKAGLAIGFVDNKKCAVDEVWSGLKFVIRKELR